MRIRSVTNGQDRPVPRLPESVSRSMRGCQKRFGKYSSSSMIRGLYIAANALSTGTRCSHGFVRYRSGVQRGQRPFVPLAIPAERRRGSITSNHPPGTMLGDTAVAVHPEDERYKDMIGKTLVLPIVREIPVIADEYVEKDFGAGG